MDSPGHCAQYCSYTMMDNYQTECVFCLYGQEAYSREECHFGEGLIHQKHDSTNPEESEN